MEDSCAPQKSSEKSFEEIKQLFLEYLKPKHLVIAESCRFYNVKQEECELLSNSFVRLKNLSSTCKFGIFLKRALRDKFVCGLNDEKIQERLLSKDMLLEEVFKIEWNW